MRISSLLSPERVLCLPQVSSKKRALEMLSEMLASRLPELGKDEIFASLLARERLGSTGLGHGVAIPHGRLSGVSSALGAVLKLRQGVDYDAPDSEPVDIMFALLVPEECTDEHLQILARLARMFSQPAMLSQLRVTEDPADVLIQMQAWDEQSAT